jgi:hypothetical protein
MGKAKTPKPVKLIVSMLTAQPTLWEPAEAALVDAYGPADWSSPVLDFDHTDYYTAEMGAGLQRVILTFRNLIDPGQLAAIKLFTNALEASWAEESGDRPLNLDPGYLSLSKMVLATTKNHAHRIYIGQGIYAEVTLHYYQKAFRAWPWTYPDYGSDEYCRLFEEIRERYVAQLRAL